MNEYPTKEELEKLLNWDVVEDLAGFLEYLEGLWNTDYGIYEISGKSLKLVTGGWSGNEDIINSLPIMFSMSYWSKSECGGRYFFDRLKL